MRFLPADLDDRLNPFLVKEARQLVRSKAVVGGQWVLLLVLPVAMAVAYARRMELSNAEDGQPGQVVFLSVHGTWVSVCVYFIPLYVWLRMACESADREGMDMLRGTSMTASRIVVGKWMSGFLVGLLALSVFAPCMAFCYFLRGVGLDMILASVWVGCLQMAIGALLGVYAGANGRGWIIKVVTALLYVLFSGCFVGISSSAILPSRMLGGVFGVAMLYLTLGAGVLLLVSYGLAVSSVKILLADKYARRLALERQAGTAGRWLGARLRKSFTSSSGKTIPSPRKA